MDLNISSTKLLTAESDSPPALTTSLTAPLKCGPSSTVFARKLRCATAQI